MAKHASQINASTNQPEKRLVKRVARIIAALLAILILAVVGLVAVLTITEYHPAEMEDITPAGKAARNLTTGEEFSILTWNVGYGALGNNADFFMDGGHMVRTATAARVQQNMADIVQAYENAAPDIAIFQEVDVNSDRSWNINEVTLLETAASKFQPTQGAYATNYRTLFVPLGVPPYGKIEGGLLTLSSFAVSQSTRVALPCSYSWPMSTMQLKRCELVTRIPVEGSEHELVLINEHPDAYTDEEHHAIQIAAIRETLTEEAAKGNWVIAGGDWNHTFSNVDISNYPLLDENNWAAGYLNENDFGQGWQFVMDNTHPTCRLLDHALVNEQGDPLEEIVQYYMLDGFIVSSNVEVVSVETQNLGFVASDHNPVVMKVLLN